MTARKNPADLLKNGAPTKYNPSYDEQVRKLCLLGSIDREIADFFNVTETTINNWKIEHPSFFEAIKEGREKADTTVADSLYKRANGYEHPEDQIFQFQGSPVVVPTIKHYPPDSTAAIFWLKNRSKKWRDIHTIDVNQIQEDISKTIIDICEIAKIYITDAKKYAEFISKIEQAVSAMDKK
jgi:hypothetical protein